MNSISVQEAFYESDPGILRWKIDVYTGKSKKRLQVKKGDIAGSFCKADGRWKISFQGKSYNRARIMWILYNGTIPSGMDIDHINRNYSDDMIENLRCATKTQNQYNRGIKSNNSSGYIGVHWCETYKKWKAQISINGKKKSLGYYTTPQQASSVYNEIAKSLHGRFYAGDAV